MERRRNIITERQKNKIFVDKYFRIENDRAACRLCTQTLKSDRTFNLKMHVKKVHSIDFEIIKRTHRFNDYLVDNPEKKTKMSTIKIEIEKRELMRSFIGLVIEDGMPFHILDSDNFKDIIRPIYRGFLAKNDKVFTLNAEKCKYDLNLVADNVRKDLKSELKQKFISLKVDAIATSGLLSSFIAISALYIDDDEIQSCLMGIEELVHESDLVIKINNILNKYELNSSQVISVTMDPGHLQSYKDLASRILFDDIEILPYASHIAHICALDVVNDSDELLTFLDCCRNFVKYICNSCNGYLDIFEENNLKIPRIDLTNNLFGGWSTTYQMIKDLKQAKDILVDLYPVKNEFQKEHFKLDINFWQIAEAFCIAFEPLQNAFEKFQNEILHFGNFYAEWLKCKICTEKINTESTDKPFVRTIATSLLEKMEVKTSELLKNEKFISCLYLDPRFNHTLNAMEKLAATSQLKKLYEKIKSPDDHSFLENAEENSNSSSTLTQATSYNEQADELLHDYLTRNFVPSTSDNFNVFVKIENLQLPFQRVDTNILHFWTQKQNTLPELYDLSNICFAVPASQVCMERYFSSLTPVADKQSGRIDMYLLENILLVKLNSSYLDQAIDDFLLCED